MSTATAKKKKYYQFKLLAGRHTQGGRSRSRGTDGTTDPGIPSQKYNRGDVFISDQNLDKFNTPGMVPKFQFLREATEEEWKAQQRKFIKGPEQEEESLQDSSSVASAAPAVQIDDGLEDLTVDQLVQLANTSDADIDLRGKTRKVEIIAALRLAGVKPD